MRVIYLIVLSAGLFAPIFGQEARISTLKEKKQTKVKKARGGSSYLQEVYRSNQELKKLLSQRSQIPVVWEGEQKILTGAVFKGILLNSVQSTNLSSPLLVRVHPDQGLPSDTLFSCIGVTANKRVQTRCSKMILPEREVKVSAVLLNEDGSAGLTGHYEDASEDKIAGIIASDVAKGVFATAQSQLTGNSEVLGGLIGGANGASDVLIEQMGQVSPVVTIDSEKEVLIYFTEAVNDY